jgi:hypothetical protein
MISAAFANQILTEEEDQRITGLCKIFGITANDLGDLGARFAKSQILKRLDEGKFPENVRVNDVPIVFEHNETVVWLFNDVNYYTLRKRTQYVGASHGVSIRVMKGVYYRVGGFKGEPIQTQYLADEGRGFLVLTSRNIYFWSPQKVLKLPLKKIISMQPYTDGIHIVRDAANAVPQTFKLDDPLFACDAIARLNQL